MTFVGLDRFAIRVLLGAGAILLAATIGMRVADAADAPTAALPVKPDNTQPLGDASIQFADHGGIFDWRADGTKGIWVQSTARKWYYGTFMNTCTGLNFADKVGFVTEPNGDFNRWSAVIVPDNRQPACRLMSFTASVGPPQHVANVTAMDQAKTSKPIADATNDNIEGDRRQSTTVADEKMAWISRSNAHPQDHPIP